MSSCQFARFVRFYMIISTSVDNCYRFTLYSLSSMKREWITLKRQPLATFEREHRRQASYVAFTRETTDGEVEVMLGVVNPSQLAEPQRYGFPGGGRKRIKRGSRSYHRKTAHKQWMLYETPVRTARRETFEEMGMYVPSSELQLALSVEKPNPITGKGTQIAHVFLHTGSELPKRFKRAYQQRREMGDGYWFTQEKAQTLHEIGLIGDDVLTGVQIAIESHMLHKSDKPLDPNRFEILATPDDIRKYMSSRRLPSSA